jgi:hypothetical protein
MATRAGVKPIVCSVSSNQGLPALRSLHRPAFFGTQSGVDTLVRVWNRTGISKGFAQAWCYARQAPKLTTPMPRCRFGWRVRLHGTGRRRRRAENIRPGPVISMRYGSGRTLDQ